MKHIIILTFLLFTKIIAQDYFPLEVGNTWTYRWNFDTTNTITYQISDSINIGNMKYFLYENVLNNTFIDTIRKDYDGNVWKRLNETDYLWFDFTKDNGSSYTFPSFDSVYAYRVTLSKSFTRVTIAGTYSQCIDLFFEIPQFRDVEIRYSFAPNAGLVEKYYGEGPDYLLYSIKLNSDPLEIVKDKESKPISYKLLQNYPNPFNPATNIEFDIPFRNFVSLKVFDINGKEMATLVNNVLAAGNHIRQFKAANMPNGVYFYRLQVGSYTKVKKLIILK